MWNGLMFGLASLFTAEVPLPDSRSMYQEVGTFAQQFEINSKRVVVRESQISNPSPFLTSSGGKQCVVHINSHDQARQVWSHLVNSDQPEVHRAYEIFSMGHELTHCMLGEPGRRAKIKSSFETQLGVRFNSNAHFEESIADLVGLAYLEKVQPEMLPVVMNNLSKVRKSFSSRDPEHDSSRLLKQENLTLVQNLFEKPTQPQQLAKNEQP